GRGGRGAVAGEPAACLRGLWGPLGKGPLGGPIVAGDRPPPLPPLLGWRWPRGPFIIPVRTSASPMSASFGVCLKRLFSSETRIRRSSVAILFRHLSRGRKALRPARRRRRVRLSGHARIPNDAVDHEPVPA